MGPTTAGQITKTSAHFAPRLARPSASLASVTLNPDCWPAVLFPTIIERRTESRPFSSGASPAICLPRQRVAEGVGFEPTELSFNGFQDRRLKPLGHPSQLWNFINLPGSRTHVKPALRPVAGTIASPPFQGGDTGEVRENPYQPSPSPRGFFPSAVNQVTLRQAQGDRRIHPCLSVFIRG